MSVRLSVRSIDSSSGVRPADLLLRSGAGPHQMSVDVANAAARHAGRINIGPTVSRYSMLLVSRVIRRFDHACTMAVVPLVFRRVAAYCGIVQRNDATIGAVPCGAATDPV